jgi:kinesin family protein 2/24
MKARPQGLSPPPAPRAGMPGGNDPAGAAPGKKNTLAEIQRLQRERDERRRVMEQAKVDRAAEEQRNREMGNPGDVDFQRMIRGYREAAATPVEQPHKVNDDMKICICVRKRPVSSKEVRRNDYDSVTCLNPLVVVHDCKMRVDGISKYLDNQAFQFDHTFHEDNSTEDVYTCAVQPLVDFCVRRGGRATVFAYGQTGSGKTHTMVGVQSFIAQDLFALLNDDPAYMNIQVAVAFFEVMMLSTFVGAAPLLLSRNHVPLTPSRRQISGGRCQDLLNNRAKLSVREDGAGEVVVADLTELPVDDAAALAAVIDAGNRNRTTHATESNDESSRSHAICQVRRYLLYLAHI